MAMKQETVRSEILGEQYYRFRHPSGLTVLLYPMAGFASTYALFSAHYGSIDTAFKTKKDPELFTVPEGVAHFLEHKLFESEDGDAFSLFAKTGASANAFTSFEKTGYLFSCTDRFEESLKALVTFVQAPYFTQQTVEKEQGIIGQEIRMYEDDPDWRVLFNLLGALYHNHPVRIDIAGTTDSIAKIDEALLYRCYRTFYSLNNMVLAVAGNFDVERAAALIEENLREGEPVEVERQMPDEPETIREKEHRQKLSVAIPLFNIGYKEIPPPPEKELETQLCYELILKAAAGKGSKLYAELLQEELVNDTFGREVFAGRGYMANLFSGESRDPLRVRERIGAELKRLQQTGIDSETFSRIKKALYGMAVQSFNDVEQIANELATAHFSNRDVYDVLDVIANLTEQQVNSLLRSSFDESRMALSIIEPAE